MTLGLNDTYSLNGYIPELPRESLFIKDTFFNTTKLFNGRKFLIEEGANGTRKLARPVLPSAIPEPRKRVAGKMREYTPAYFKESFTIDNMELQERLGGEPLGGVLSPSERLARIYAEELLRQTQTFDSRLEWLACQSLLGAGYTLVSEDHPKTTLSFGRNSALVPTALSSTDRWLISGALGSTAKPIANLQALLNLGYTTSRARFDTVILGANTLTGFLGSAEVKEYLDLNKNYVDRMSLNPLPKVFKDAELICSIPLHGGNLNVWTYSATYDDESGNPQDYIDANKIIALDSRTYGGTIAYGMINHSDILAPAPLHSYVYEDVHKTGRTVISQSAPLVFMERPNSSAVWTVSA